MPPVSKPKPTPKAPAGDGPALNSQSDRIWSSIRQQVEQYGAPDAFIYFMQDETGLIKIGFSNSPERRRDEVAMFLRGVPRFGQPNPQIEILAVFRASRHFERIVHLSFDEFRHWCEWFRPALELRQFIDAIRADAGLPPADFRELALVSSQYVIELPPGLYADAPA